MHTEAFRGSEIVLSVWQLTLKCLREQMYREEMIRKLWENVYTGGIQVTGIWGYFVLFWTLIQVSNYVKICLKKRKESSAFNTTYLSTTASVTTGCLRHWSPPCYLATRPCPSSLPPQCPGTAIRAVLTPTNHHRLPVASSRPHFGLAALVLSC